ncbi:MULTISPECIES: DUF29 family protein [Burkholderiaceae]|nr:MULTISPECIES: DUF29 family protein [Burkholderiaceae]
MSNHNWITRTWADAVSKAVEETGLDVFPDACPWSMDQVLSVSSYPD